MALRESAMSLETVELYYENGIEGERNEFGDSWIVLCISWCANCNGQ